MRKPLSKPFNDERPRKEVGFIADKKVVFKNRKLILPYAEKKDAGAVAHIFINNRFMQTYCTFMTIHSNQPTVSVR
jgi:hypothetical protein